MTEQISPTISKSLTSRYVGIFLVGIIIGAVISFVYFKNLSVGMTNEYQIGFNAAKKRVLESQMGGIFSTPNDIRNLSGTVTAINGNNISIHVQIMNPFEDELLDNRNIIVSGDTKIFKITKKDQNVMQAEMNIFIKNMKASKDTNLSILPPEPFTRMSATVADIKIGDSLNVTSSENIKSLKEFSASEIQINSVIN